MTNLGTGEKSAKGRLNPTCALITMSYTLGNHMDRTDRPRMASYLFHGAENLNVQRPLESARIDGQRLTVEAEFGNVYIPAHVVAAIYPPHSVGHHLRSWQVRAR